MHTKEQLMEMHTQHNEWQNKIKFYRNELKKLNDDLGEFVLRKPSPGIMISVEHFQNQFTIQSEVLDIMRHDFKQHENAIEAKQSNFSIFDQGLVNNHESHRERLEHFEKIFHDLRDEFHGFMQKDLQNQD